jgi:uncharacterized protein (TIRG00374 family)
MKLKFWIGIIISILCLYFVFRGIDFTKVFEALQSVNYFYLLLAALVNLSTIWLRAERWKYLLAPIKTLHFKDLVPATMIGFMANNILPARAGEFIRAYMIGKKEQISKTASFATIVIERVFDMVIMLLFLVIVLIFVKFPQSMNSSNPDIDASLLSPSLMQKAGIVSAVFVIALLTFLVLLKEFPQKTTSIVQKILTPLPRSLTTKVLDLLHSFRLGLQVLTTGKHLVYLIFWSFSVWLASVLGGWCILWSFGLKFPFIAAMFIMVLVAFSVALPSSPGYIGPFHAAVLTGVLFFLPTLNRSTAASIAIVYHLTAIIPITLMGLFYLWKENMSLAEIKHIEEEEEKQQSEISPEY